MFTMAVLQSAARINAVTENLERIAMFAQKAASRGADLLMTPELFTTGYAPGLVKHSDGEMIRAELARIARQQGIALVGSSVEAAGSDLHICASLFDDQGNELTRYRKAHLFGPDEKATFAPGNTLPELVPYRGLTLALGLCYDIEFPEYARSAAVRGADVLCIPTAVPTTGDVGGGGEELLIAEIDEAEVRRARKINTYLDCVRTDLYSPQRSPAALSQLS